MTALRLDIETPERMRLLGKSLGDSARAGDRFLLVGPFGAGKTTFVQGLAEGLGVKTPIGSPSFVIETQYRGRLVLYHVDLYRVDRLEPELLEQLEEHLYGDGVTAVEWADRLPPRFHEGATVLRIAITSSGRAIELTAPDGRLESAARAT